MMKPRVLITGATGFIGKAVIKELLIVASQAQVGTIMDYSLFAFSRHPYTSSSEIEWIPADIHNRDKLRSAIRHVRPDFVLHLAWSDLPDFSIDKCSLNLQAGIELVSTLARFGCRRIVLAGSCLEYGERTGRVTEDSYSPNLSPFASAKRALYDFSRTIGLNSGFEVLEARIFYSYGFGQRSGSLVPTLISSLKEGRPLTLKTPSAAHDFVEVSDVARALTFLLLNPNIGSGVYNIGSGKLTSVQEIVSTAAQILEVDSPLEDFSSPIGMYADSSKLNDIGWRPKVDLVEGINRYLTLSI